MPSCICRAAQHSTRWAFVCFVLFCFVGAARAQSANTLEGRVLLPNNEPPNVSVRVSLRYQGRPLFETFTDLSGRFSFTGLQAGTYQLVAESDGSTFETTSVSADIIAFGNAPQVFTQNIQLRLKPGAPLPPAATVSAEELDPNIPEAARKAYQRGVKNAAEHKPEQAVKDFQEAVNLYPQFYAATLALGEQAAQLKRYDDAIAAYRRASELKPERPEAYVGIGGALVAQERFKEGITLLRGVVQVNQQLHGVYLPLGYAEMMTHDYEQAEAHLLHALELDKPPLARIYLANLYEQRSQPARAIEQLQAYLKENPQSPNAAAVRTAIDKLRGQLKK